MTDVRVNAGARGNFALSETRVQKLLAGDIEGAGKMGLVDRFKDLFRTDSKRAALDDLISKFEGTENLDALARFERLSEHLIQKSDMQSLRVGVGAPDHEGTAQVSFFIRGKEVRTMPLNERATLAHLGVAVPHSPDVRAPVEAQASWLNAHLRQAAGPESAVRDDHFAEGGVHKKVAKMDGQVIGLLRADDDTGKEDFNREQRMADHAEHRPELARYISTQRRVGPEELPPGLNAGGAYARFDIYDKEAVKAGEMDKVLTELKPEQARSAMAQTVDLMRVLYKNDVSHRDLHMHNLMIYQETGNPQNITVKAIDFGKSQCGEGVTQKRGLDDLRYIFNRTAIGIGDGIRRSYREAGLPLADTASVQKHYPLHRLLAQMSLGDEVHDLAACVSASDQFNELLDNVGNKLTSDLQEAEQTSAGDAQLRDTKIDQAFFRAAAMLDDVAVKLTRPNTLNAAAIPSTWLRG